MKRATIGPLACAALLAGLAQAGCGGGKSPDAGEADKPVPGAPASQPAAADEADLSALDAIPTTDEIEAELEQTVTDANADAEFEKLQKELEAEDGR